MRRKYYKQNYSNQTMYETGVMQKRGQMTLIVIIGIVIVAIIVILFLLWNKNIQGPETTTLNPSDFLEKCIEPKIRPVINELADQGGYFNPEGYIRYKDKKIKYLCYTSSFYKTCVVQQPMIKQHFEEELAKNLGEQANGCMDRLEEEYKNRGYNVKRGSSSASISILPGRMEVKFNSPLTITGKESRSFNSFNVNIKSELYDLLLTATSIIDFESTLGDSETTLYMQYYPDLKIEKVKLSDGSKVYTLTNVVTGEYFTFASRSLSWPPGYGLE